MELTINNQGETWYTGDKFLDKAVNSNLELFKDIDFNAPALSFRVECLSVARNKIDNEQFVREMLVECVERNISPAKRVELFGEVFFENVQPQFVKMYFDKLATVVGNHGEDTALHFVRNQISELRGSNVLQILTRKWVVAL